MSDNPFIVEWAEIAICSDTRMDINLCLLLQLSLQSLIDACCESAEELLRSNHGKEVLFEVMIFPRKATTNFLNFPFLFPQIYVLRILLAHYTWLNLSSELEVANGRDGYWVITGDFSTDQNGRNTWLKVVNFLQTFSLYSVVTKIKLFQY